MTARFGRIINITTMVLGLATLAHSSTSSSYRVPSSGRLLKPITFKAPKITWRAPRTLRVRPMRPFRMTKVRVK